MNQKLVLYTLLSACIFQMACAKEPVVSVIEETDPDIPVTNDYTVSIETKGTTQALTCYDLMGPSQKLYDKGYSKRPVFVHTSLSDGAMEVKIQFATAVGRAGDEVIIRPLSLNIVPVVEGNTISFSIAQPTRLSIEIGGNLMRPLLFFADPPEDESTIPDPSGAGVHYFKKGRELVLKDNDIVYLEAGAVVEGAIWAQAKNVKILGRGIFYYKDNLSLPRDQGEANARWGGHPFRFLHADNLLIDGPVFVNAQETWTMVPYHCNNATFRNIEIISKIKDGFDPIANTNLRLSDSFIMSNDDCISPKTKGIPGNIDHNLFENLVLFNSGGGWAIRLGGENSESEYLQNITFKNIDIIHALSPEANQDEKHNGAIAIIAVLEGEYRDILFDNIRIEPLDEPALFRMYIGDMYFHTGGPYTNIHDVIFKDIHVSGSISPSTFIGRGANHKISNITFDNLQYNGKKIMDRKEAMFNANEYVSEITFK
ncbi:MAG: hypothetical protein HC819_11815 [Cyclobacteriaceae bacterium]|nr:hypothetical protein [Cyclobacteriaceae bacterium]